MDSEDYKIKFDPLFHEEELSNSDSPSKQNKKTVNSKNNTNQNNLNEVLNVNQLDESNVKVVPFKITKTRIKCLDIFRGITLALMINVNANSGEGVYWFFDESEWNGLTPADCIFPSFLFMMGVAVILAIHIDDNPLAPKIFRIIRRSIIIFALGLVLQMQEINFYDWKFYRVMGVLQRLGLCYLLVSLAHLLLFRVKFGFLYQFLFMFSFLLTYVLFTYVYYVPNDCGKGNITPYCFAGSYIDRLIFGDGHVYIHGITDPEGLLSTLTAVYPVYIGYLYGVILKQYKDHTNKFMLFYSWLAMSIFNFIIGIIAIYAIGLDPNKKVYSISFAFLVCGISGFCLTLMHIIIDKGSIKYPIIEKVFNPFNWLGTNSLLIYSTSRFFNIVLQENVKFYSEEYQGKVGLWTWLFDKAFKSWIAPVKLASFFYSFAIMLIFFLVGWICVKKGWYLKI